MATNLYYITNIQTKATSRKGQHVVPRESGWVVLKSGAVRVTSKHETQSDAIDAARRIAKNQKTEVYIHGTDGRIRERRSFGSDPHPPKG